MQSTNGACSIFVMSPKWIMAYASTIMAASPGKVHFPSGGLFASFTVTLGSFLFARGSASRMRISRTFSRYTGEV